LQYRIVIPFVIVVLVATAGAALVALSVTSRALHSRVQAQLSSAAAVVGRGDLALNPAVLPYVRGLLGADIITFDDQGRVVTSTVGRDREALIQAVRRVVTAASGGAKDVSSVVATDCGAPCLVAYRPVEGRPEFVVALVAETSELTAATRAVTRTIVLGAVLSAVVMVLVGQAVVRRVTAPLDSLVRFARELSPQDFSRRAPVGHDEVGALAEAFNGMLERLERSQEALVRSEKLALAGLFAARVAHDIRNPLSSIKMQTQLLLARLRGDADDVATLTSVLHDINQVESVILDLVELARPGELRLELTSPNAVIRDALQKLAAQLAHRRISVRMDLSEDLPDVRLDHVRFRQGLLNVLVNASEAMPTGGELTVTSRRDAATVSIEICDDGTGVAPEILDRVFDPFVSTKREGVGLGLVNAKAVVEGHGGRISLASRRPKGTCALITLPVQPKDG
jgi:signal transduction histidine kinase